MLTDAINDDAARRSGLIRSSAAASGLRGSCCTDCAEGLGDLTSLAQRITQSSWLDTLFIVSLSIGAIAGGLSIYDHMKKRRRRRRIRHTSPTMQIPVQSMHDLVYGEDRDAA